MIDERQPVHVVYGGAHLFKATTVPKLGLLAVRHMTDHAADPFEFAEAVGMPEARSLPSTRSARITLLRRFTRMGWKAAGVHPAAWIATSVYQRVLEKLQRHAVEDYRIDFEDGYGVRGHEEEDAHAIQAAEQTAEAFASRSLPPCFGIRIKPFVGDARARSRRTLDLYLTRLLQRTEGRLPSQFVVTVPKVGTVDEIEDLVRVVTALERSLGLSDGSLRLELMVETPPMIMGGHGASILPDVIAACQGRCRGLHLGLYDFLSSMDVVSSAQMYRHPMADHLRVVAKAAAAPHGLWLADGATNRIPLGPHRTDRLNARQRAENRAAVHEGWAEVYRHVDHSLQVGYYQGWDLHPSQLPPRYAAVFGLFIREEAAASARLRSFLDVAAQAVLRGQQFDDAATGQGLLNFFRRGIATGAFDEAALVRAGLTVDELRSRTFSEIVEGRRRSGPST